MADYAGQEGVVWTALGALGDATVNAASELYMKSELRTKGLEVIAATVAGTSKSVELIGRVRALQDLSSVAQGAVLAHLGPRDGLERISRDLQEHNAEALLQPIELLTELHGAGSDVLTRARKLTGSRGRTVQPQRGAAPVEGKARAKQVGRNEPCPCGSGRKYKHCCLRSA